MTFELIVSALTRSITTTDVNHRLGFAQKLFFFIPWNSFQQHSDPRMFSNIHQLLKLLTNKYNYYWTTDFIQANKAEQIKTPVTDGVLIS